MTIRVVMAATGKPVAGKEVKEGIVSHGPFHFDPEADEVVIEIGDQTLLHITPGEAVVASLNSLMAMVEKSGYSKEPESASERCDQCGKPVIKSRLLNSSPVTVDAAPNERGIYMFARKGRLRTLRPFEEPIAPTYKKHTCVTGG